tara:strand:+ start:2763 stop:3062 length:300 start_codon:yes stop_codon:yes gene_type:complete
MAKIVPALATWDRICVICSDEAVGTWGNHRFIIWPQSGVIYTCLAHWEQLEREQRLTSGEPRHRPLYVQAAAAAGQIDRRLIDDGDLKEDDLRDVKRIV